jgi:hypothetical protein
LNWKGFTLTTSTKLGTTEFRSDKTSQPSSDRCSVAAAPEWYGVDDSLPFYMHFRFSTSTLRTIYSMNYQTKAKRSNLFFYELKD